MEPANNKCNSDGVMVTIIITVQQIMMAIKSAEIEGYNPSIVMKMICRSVMRKKKLPVFVGFLVRTAQLTLHC
jgi:hypothetical protein